MFKTNYYYLVAGLADLVPEQTKLAQGLSDYKKELSEQLSSSDYKLVEKVFLETDNINILNIVSKKRKDFIEGGKYDKEIIESEIKEPAFDEEYLNIFVRAYLSETAVYDGLSWEDQLSTLYYSYLAECNNDFMRMYFEFVQNINNIIVGINSRKFSIKDKNLYIGDNLVSESIRQSTLKDFGLSSEFPYIEKLLSIFEEEDLVKREMAIDRLKWDFMDELNTFNYFTVEVLLSHLFKLKMIERWIILDEKTGREMFENLINGLNDSFEFSKEFAVNKRKLQ